MLVVISPDDVETVVAFKTPMLIGAQPLSLPTLQVFFGNDENRLPCPPLHEMRSEATRNGGGSVHRYAEVT